MGKAAFVSSIMDVGYISFSFKNLINCLTLSNDSCLAMYESEIPILWLNMYKYTKYLNVISQLTLYIEQPMHLSVLYLQIDPSNILPY